MLIAHGFTTLWRHDRLETPRIWAIDKQSAQDPEFFFITSPVGLDYEEWRRQTYERLRRRRLRHSQPADGEDYFFSACDVGNWLVCYVSKMFENQQVRIPSHRSKQRWGMKLCSATWPVFRICQRVVQRLVCHHHGRMLWDWASLPACKMLVTRWVLFLAVDNADLQLRNVLYWLRPVTLVNMLNLKQIACWSKEVIEKVGGLQRYQTTGQWHGNRICFTFSGSAVVGYLFQVY